MSLELGFIGLGRMGLPMAGRLIEAGHSVTVFDNRRDAMAPLLKLGAKEAASPLDVADRVETVMASLPSPDIVLEVATGPKGVAAGSRVRRFVDLSTTGAGMAARVAKLLNAKGVALIDSPVSGGVAGAQKGSLAVMVSGPRTEIDKVSRALLVLGRIFVIGEEAGQAQTMKLLNNLLSATALAATSEAVVMGMKAGLDPAVMIDVINAGTGRNSASQDKFPKQILPGTFDAGFATGLMMKDVRLCLAEAKALGLPMDVASAVAAIWEKTHAERGPESDFTTIFQTIEQHAGLQPHTKKAG
jgi:3-hydroxyisobutyrate dehydrogenase-like beta-hydroxyacid dehydrogenase